MELEMSLSSIKRHKLSVCSDYAIIRPGSLKSGDIPTNLIKVILLEGEAYWLVEWQAGPSENSEDKFMIEDSFERQKNLVKWDSAKFTKLKEEFKANKLKK